MKRWFVFLGVLFVLLIGFVVFTFHAIELAREREYCTREAIQRLYVIGYLIDCYSKQHGQEPPAWTVDDNGKPKHSWRALLLPCFQDEEYSKKFSCDFSQSWNSSSNLQVAKAMPRVYSSPSDHASKEKQTTSFVAVVEMDAREIPRILGIIELRDTKILWTEPKDILLSELKEFVAELKRKEYCICNTKVLLPDGNVECVKEGGLTPELFKKHGDAKFTGSKEWNEPPYGYGLKQFDFEWKD